jgi:hypothetical protein
VIGRAADPNIQRIRHVGIDGDAMGAIALERPAYREVANGHVVVIRDDADAATLRSGRVAGYTTAAGQVRNVEFISPTIPDGAGGLGELSYFVPVRERSGQVVRLDYYQDGEGPAQPLPRERGRPRDPGASPSGVRWIPWAPCP